MDPINQIAAVEEILALFPSSRRETFRMPVEIAIKIAIEKAYRKGWVDREENLRVVKDAVSRAAHASERFPEGKICGDRDP